MVVPVQDGAFNTGRVRRVGFVRRVSKGGGESLYLGYSYSVVWFWGCFVITGLVLVVQGQQIPGAIISRVMGISKEEVAGKCEDL